MQIIKATIFDRKGNVLSIGYNSYTKTHPFQYKLACKCGNPKRPFLHAEIDAITKLKKRINEAYSIYIERYWKDGTPGLAKPCKICELAISKTPIREIYYTGV